MLCGCKATSLAHHSRPHAIACRSGHRAGLALLVGAAFPGPASCWRLCACTSSVREARIKFRSRFRPNKFPAPPAAQDNLDAFRAAALEVAQLWVSFLRAPPAPARDAAQRTALDARYFSGGAQRPRWLCDMMMACPHAAYASAHSSA